jgi:hypothetical protein
VGGREIDPRLPFLGAAFGNRLWRNPELHWQSPFPIFILGVIVAEFDRLVTEIAAELPSRIAALRRDGLGRIAIAL